MTGVKTFPQVRAPRRSAPRFGAEERPPAPARFGDPRRFLGEFARTRQVFFKGEFLGGAVDACMQWKKGELQARPARAARYSLQS